MQFRSITQTELAPFAAISGDHERNEAIQQYLQRLIEGNYARPQWYWVAEHDGQWLGRLAYSGDRDENTPAYLVWLDVLPGEDESDIAAALIQESLAHIRTPAMRQIESLMDVPSPLIADPKRYTTLIHAGGFSHKLERRTFAWTPEYSVPPASTRLTFRTLTEVGDEAFIATMARITEGTLDNYTQELVRDLGTAGAAQQHFHDEQRYQKRWEPHWWQMGFTSDGEVVGVVMPAENNRWPNIGYIGVVPEQRGHGYSDDLLAQGTRTLIEEGAQRIIADTDMGNVPMANAFLRMGYQQYATRRIDTLTIASAAAT